MGDSPNPKKRSYLLPPGFHDLGDVLQGTPMKSSLISVQVNGKIKANEVRVVGDQAEQLGIMSRPDALRLAQSRGLDLVEIAPKAKPPISRIVDFEAFRAELLKKRNRRK